MHARSKVFCALWTLAFVVAGAPWAWMQSARAMDAAGPCVAGEPPCALEAPPPAAPQCFGLQRQDYGYWTHFLLSEADGSFAGLVERRHWQQVFRRSYEAQDAAGNLRGKTSSPWLSLGNLFSWQAHVNLEDAQGRHTGHLAGHLLTLRAATYTLYNAAGTAVAVAAVDDRAQGVVFVATGSKRVVATFMREQQATRGCDRWSMRVCDPTLVAAEAWPLVAAFFADTWTSLARDHRDG